MKVITLCVFENDDGYNFFIFQSVYALPVFVFFPYALCAYVIITHQNQF